MNDILLISKDILRKDYLSCYSKRFNTTPNIDLLAKKGTIFHNCYCDAPSTAMATTCMFSGLHAYELNRGEFVEVEQFDQTTTIFSELERRGYETHVLYDIFMKDLCEKKSKVFSPNTTVHHLLTFNDFATDPKSKYWKDRHHLENPEENYLDYLKELNSILEKRSAPIFVWMHCPHGFYPRVGSGNDIDLFDDLVGKIVNLFKGEIMLTADHGALIGENNVYGYGFHNYEGAVNIPLITPNYFGKNEIYDYINQAQLKNIILEHKLKPQEFVYCDTQYYKQPNRKLMLIKDGYKYIYNKVDETEELYDLDVDPLEHTNLLVEEFYDYDRNHMVRLDDYFPYSRWGELEHVIKDFRNEKDRIWKSDTMLKERLNEIRYKYQFYKKRLRVMMTYRNSFAKGLCGSKVKFPKPL